MNAKMTDCDSNILTNDFLKLPNQIFGKMDGTVSLSAKNLNTPQGIKNVKSEMMDFSKYEDSDTIHSWAKVPLCWGIKNNLIAGRTSTTLSPREATTRAEFATIMMRFLNI